MALIAVMMLSVNAHALSVLLAGNPADSVYGYGETQWSNFTAALDAATSNNITLTPAFMDMAQMMAHDAIFLDLRLSPALSPQELANISAYMGTGRKVLMMGETNGSWAAWNAQILSLVGGVSIGDFTGPTTAVGGHPLTAGVASVVVPLGGVATGAGTPLFAQNWATLWGDNVLTLLDSNTFENIMWGTADNQQFALNVAAWIADSRPAPIPGAIWLLGSGLAGLVAIRRRMKN